MRSERNDEQNHRTTSRLVGSVFVALLACSGCYEAPAPTQFDGIEIEELPASVEPADLEALPGATRDPAVAPTPERDEPPVIQANVDQQPWIAPSELPWTLDYVQYFNGRQIGFSHIEVLASAIDNADQIRIRRTDSVEIVESGERSRVVSHLEAIEGVTGELRSFTATTKRGDAETNVEAIAQASNVRLKTTVKQPDLPDQSSTRSVKWEPGAWGTLGVQAMLLRSPMQPGEQRQTQVFVPSLNRIADAYLTAGQWELTPLAGGRTPELLPIDITMETEGDKHLEPSRMRSKNWINSRGEIEKTVALTGPSVTTFRVSRSTTQRLEAALRVEQLKDHIIPLAGVGNEPAETFDSAEERKFQIETSNIDPFKLIIRDADQQVRSLGPRTAEIAIRRPPAVAGDSSSRPPAAMPTEADLGATEWLPTQHAVIAELAAELAGESSTTVDVARAVTRGVFDQVQPQAFNGKFANVLETARSRAGSCVDRAMLLAAILRHRDVPARVVSGLRVDDQSSQAVYHMWTKAWIDERWLSLDPCSGEPAGSSYIAMHEDSLEGDNPYSAALPVLEAMPNITRLQVITE